MGRKVSPIAYRLGVNKNWKSVWYQSKKDYARCIHEDYKIRNYLKTKLYQAGISSIDIERMGAKVKITLNTSRPGMVIGKKGSEIDKLRLGLSKIVSNEVVLVINEIRKPELDATLVAESVALQLQRRVAFRRAMKKAVLQSLKAGAKGIKVSVSGRLAGADMAKTEWYLRGRVPLQTLRADIDFGFSEALTTFGIIGVKVWIYKGDIFDTYFSGIIPSHSNAAMADKE